MLPLTFHKNGKFKIMQVADIQDTQHTAPDTIRFLSAVLEAEQPDLAVLTGDQLKGYGVSFRGGDPKQKVRRAIDQIVRPFEQAGVPFTVTFGNHDEQAGADKNFQMLQYRSYPHFVQEHIYKGLAGEATFALEVKGSGGSITKLGVFVMDSLSSDRQAGGYAGVSKEQLDWFRQTSAAMEAANGAPVPAILFQHIPVPEMYELLDKVAKGSPGAVLGNLTHRDYYALPKALADNPKNFMLENIACSTVNTGEFETIAAQGNVFAMFFGHDHNNSFVGNYNGIDLGYCQGCGFNVYGPGLDRGVRIFEFSQDAPRAYKTRTVTYRDVLGTRLKRPVKNLFYTYAPSSIDAAKPLLIKAGAGAALGTAAGIAVTLLRKRR